MGLSEILHCFQQCTFLSYVKYVTKDCEGNNPNVKHDNFTCIKVRDEFEFQGFSISHHDGDDFGFSACVSYASGMRGSYGPYMTRIGHGLNPSIMSC